MNQPTDQSLTNNDVYGLFIAMHNGMTPEEMNRYADQLEEAARGLRISANALSGIMSNQPLPFVQNPVSPKYVPSVPTVLQAAERILRQSSRPMKLSELFNAIRASGGQVSNKGNLSSMLSKDFRTTFEPVPGARGFWQLVGAKNTFSNVNKPGA